MMSLLNSGRFYISKLKIWIGFWDDDFETGFVTEKGLLGAGFEASLRFEKAGLKMSAQS